MVSLPPPLQTLLEQAQSEAKRLGHPVTEKRHLAIALLRRYPTKVLRFWGNINEDDILRHPEFPPELGGQSVEEFLEMFADCTQDVFAPMCEQLRDELGLSGPPEDARVLFDEPATSHEQTHDTAMEDAEPERRTKQPLDVEAVRRCLLKAVVGQDDVIERVIRRLTLTRANLDLHPNRPDGIFLFAGPTGVGKTEFAKALAAAVLDDEQAFIRLDMSEYGDDEYGIARLVGPGPGYVGYNQPEGWLTTRVMEQPQSVLLLDEIEKAHRSVWHVFLQVFDDGRLTDGRGRTASFADVIVVMTSNIGAHEFYKHRPGFHSESDHQVVISSAVEKEIRKTLPAELFNRIDEVVVFRELSLDDVREIARRQIARHMSRLAAAGYELEIADEAIDLIARTNYDPTLGARHVLRNIEQMLLSELV
ncbi:MAG: AAA family ATPase, partial [Candidatus Dadabacteria bacterium]